MSPSFILLALWASDGSWRRTRGGRNSIGIRYGWLIMAGAIHRLLDKIAKDIMVCENKTIRRWDGSIGSYKNHLRKKMVTMGQV